MATMPTTTPPYPREALRVRLDLRDNCVSMLIVETPCHVCGAFVINTMMGDVTGRIRRQELVIASLYDLRAVMEAWWDANMADDHAPVLVVDLPEWN